MDMQLHLLNFKYVILDALENLQSESISAGLNTTNQCPLKGKTWLLQGLVVQKKKKTTKNQEATARL